MADRKHVEKFISELNSYFEVRTSYSGRGMYGDTCVSVTFGRDEETSLGDVMEGLFLLGIEVGSVKDPGEEDIKLETSYAVFLRSVSMDGMGRGTVIYFPAADTTGWGKDEDEDDDEYEDQDDWDESEGE